MLEQGHGIPCQYQTYSWAGPSIIIDKKIKAILLAESPKVFIELHTPAEGILQLLWLHPDPLTVYAQWMLCWIYVY